MGSRHAARRDAGGGSSGSQRNGDCVGKTRGGGGETGGRHGGRATSPGRGTAQAKRAATPGRSGAGQGDGNRQLAADRRARRAGEAAAATAGRHSRGTPGARASAREKRGV